MRHLDDYTAYRTSCFPLYDIYLLQDSDDSNRRPHRQTGFSLNQYDDILMLSGQRQRHRMAASKLLALPAELRIEIIEYALQEHFALGVGGSYTLSQFAPKVFGGDAVKQATQPPLTRVSRQIRRETLALFYSLNTFVLALHYRRARAEVDKWIDSMSSNLSICASLRSVTIKHRFGILDFRGTIDFDIVNFRILGPKLWYNAIPPLTRREVERIVEIAHDAERSPDLIVRTLRQLVDLLGIEAPVQTSINAS